MDDIIIIKNTTDYKDVDFHKGATILVDKPKNWTSFDVVNKVRNRLRKIYNIKNFKVGHAGTLDPLATGLLVLCTGKNTKLISGFQNDTKHYSAVVKLGATTESYDREYPEENIKETKHLKDADVKKAVKSFKGVQEQMPPMFSAIKKNGVPLYKLARKGQKIKVDPREINIKSIKVNKIDGSLVYIDMHCSKGTYVRSIANDLGQKLGVGAYLYDLVRTSSGQLSLNDAVSLDSLIENLEIRMNQNNSVSNSK